jgi:hypothetical protein
MSAINRFLNLFRSKALQRDIDAEVQFHIERRIERNLRDGMSRADAQADARRRFGNVARVAEDMREARVMTWLESSASRPPPCLRCWPSASERMRPYSPS